MKVIDKYKYLYFTPSWYSEFFYISKSHIKKSDLESTLIMGGNDTLYCNRISHGFKNIPDFITLFPAGKATKFIRVEMNSYNIKNIPTVRFWDQLTLGPLFDRSN